MVYDIFYLERLRRINDTSVLLLSTVFILAQLRFRHEWQIRNSTTMRGLRI